MRVKFVFLLLTVMLPSNVMAENLTFQTSQDAQSVVYEIPDGKGRAEAVRYVEFIRDKFFPNLETVDATNLDESVPKEKIRGPFVLYTTIGSRLFDAVTKPLNIQIDDGTFSWNGINAPVSDLRVFLIGKNPYGDGYCTVQAAGSNRMLDGINSCPNGPCSYHIYESNQLLKEGLYNEAFVISDGRLTQAEAEADVAVFLNFTAGPPRSAG